MGQDDYTIIGGRQASVDALPKATGEAKYSVDIQVPGMLWGKVLRSKHPHARILHIDTTKAENLTGVKAVITHKDVQGKKFGFVRTSADQYPLAVDKVRYIGDEIAAVAAVDEEVAEEALSLIQVDYEVLPPVFDPLEAMDPEAPKIHDRDNNISARLGWELGDTEKGFRESDFVRQDTFYTQTVNHCPLEPHACVASFESPNNLTIWASTQGVFYLRNQLSRVLGLPIENIRVLRTNVGGAFGGKIELFPFNVCAAILSQKIGKPVKIVCTREEVFTATRRRHPMIIHLKTGVKKDGTLVAIQARVILDGGAYNSTGPVATYLPGAFLCLPLKAQNIKYEGIRVYTNKPVCGAQRGHAVPQIRFAVESQLDIIAQSLNLDPIELHRKNAVQAGDITLNKQVITSCGFSECLAKIEAQRLWEPQWGKGRGDKGIGLATCSFVSGATYHLFFTTEAFANAYIEAHEDGTVTLVTGVADIGQGSDTVLSMIAAEELGIEIDKIKLITSDTALTPYDWGSGSSRVTYQAGNAVKMAAIEVKNKLLEIASQTLDALPEQLVAKEGRIFIPQRPEIGISFAEAVTLTQKALKNQPVIGRGHFQPQEEKVNLKTGEGNTSPAYSFGAQLAEVEIDKELGKVKVNKMIVAHDCGRALNPMAVEGQIEGSIAMGHGQALYEELIQEKGQTLNPDFINYHVPTALDVPEVETMLVESIDPRGPFGAKESGEGIIVSTIPAIANAIADATGIRLSSLPLTPEKLLKSLEQKK
jgi:4-hydroxybenzoyl-CoA reductase subunit alpha